MIREVRQASTSVAAVIIERGTADLRLSPGADPLITDTLFELGSVTKTLTALLLAQMTLAGEAALQTRIGDVLHAGGNADITLGQLATHTAGLPRLPQNLMAKARVTPQDPYSTYDAEDLLADLQAHPVAPSAPVYSNYGYMVLGLALSKIGGRSLGTLMADRVFAPLSMTNATFDAGISAPHQRVQGYLHGDRVPHWSKLLPGAGGAEASINDVTAYLRAQVEPATSELEAALEMTQRPLDNYDACLGWQQAAGGTVRWHNGGTGGFSTFVGFDRGAGAGVAILVNAGNLGAVVDRAGFRALGMNDPAIE
ncbi:MAG: hypothetical protein QOE35_2035 [Actinomycetota bacterium]|jgi:CubicO group peptidase (beta-lactamase class C family)